MWRQRLTVKSFRNENSNINRAVSIIFFGSKSNEKQTPYFCRDIQSLELVRLLYCSYDMESKIMEYQNYDQIKTELKCHGIGELGFQGLET